MTEADVVLDDPQRSPSASGVSPRRTRIESVDVLRGIIMILMALDHTRDFFGNAAVNPTDPATTTVPLFFTRWVTHICAPGFFLLTGVGAALTLRRLSRGELARFLFTRGLWLIFLEIVIVRDLGWQFNFDYRLTVLNVLWALGWAMIFLSALLRLPAWMVTAIGAVMIATHNLLDGVQAASLGRLAPLWNVLHAPGVVLDDSRHVVFLAYALIPWIGVTAVGYGLGEVYRWEPERRRRFLLQLGLAAVAAFLVLRTLNFYGDPRHVHAAGPPQMPYFMRFINTNKYPASLDFLLMTLGPTILLLPLAERARGKIGEFFSTFGRVPMFYYLLHIPTIHFAALLVSLARQGRLEPWLFANHPAMVPPAPDGYRWPLLLLYAVFILVVAVLYFPCRAYARKKATDPSGWMRYI